MKIKALASICAKRKTIRWYDREHRDESCTQYVGDGGALYPMYGLIPMEAGGLLTLMDVPTDKRSEWYAEPMGAVEEIYDLRDAAAGEIPAIEMPLTIQWGGMDLKPLLANDRLVLIQKRYLKPLADAKSIELYARQDRHDRPYIVCKQGLDLIGMIMPIGVEHELMDDILTIGRRMVEAHKRGEMEGAEG